MKLLSVDIEISDIFEMAENEDIEKYAPFDISVAATAIHGGECEERLWYSADANGTPLLNMMPEKAHEMLEYLRDMQAKGFMVCAWNGLGFDMKWLGHVSGQWKLAAEIALKIYDPMFQFFNQRGFPIGLAKVAEGMGIKQTKLMEGADAPIQWAAGNYSAVMDYVLGDCQMTNQVILAIQAMNGIRWITRRGTRSSEAMPQLKTAEEVIQTPGPPDQSWMDNPLPKSKFYEWLL